MPSPLALGASMAVARSPRLPLRLRGANWPLLLTLAVRPWYERQTILGTASELFLRIYRRPLPVAQ